MLTSQAASMSIASLGYFIAVIDEVVNQASTPESYWAYVQRQAMSLERQWLAYIHGRTNSAPTTR